MIYPIVKFGNPVLEKKAEIVTVFDDELKKLIADMKTAHAHAYATLSTQFKEFNLECVGCHVTGYERAGGTTVTHVDKLRDVQCEVCHGPGSKHVRRPSDPSAIITSTRLPLAETCLRYFLARSRPRTVSRTSMM